MCTIFSIYFSTDPLSLFSFLIGLKDIKAMQCNVDLVQEGRQKEEADGAAEPAHEVAGDGAGDALRVQEAVVQSRGVNVRAERSL